MNPKPSRLSSGQVLNHATANIAAFSAAKKAKTMTWSSGREYVSTGARNPPMMPRTASGRESWTTESTPAAAVMINTADAAGTARRTSYTAKAA